MKFSVTVMPRVEDRRIAVEAESLGYDAIWFADNPLLWPDCYMMMALAAQATTKIRLGTGIAVPGLRIAPVTAHSIASVNQIAPGRVFLGIGVGGSGARVVGQKPMRLAQFDEYLRVLRGLLNGEEVDYTAEGATSSIRFMNAGAGFRNVEQRIPIYVAANGPKALQLAGRYGDGLVSMAGEDADTVASRLELVHQGARVAGRTLGPDFHTTTVTNAVVLRPGETLRSERVIDGTEALVAAYLHVTYGSYQQTGDESLVPAFMHGIWEEYRDYVESLDTPPQLRFREILEGHGTHCLPEERRFVTPELIEACALVAGPDEIAERLRKAEAAGLSEVTLISTLGTLSELLHDFTEVMKRF